MCHEYEAQLNKFDRNHSHLLSSTWSCLVCWKEIVVDLDIRVCRKTVAGTPRLEDPIAIERDKSCWINIVRRRVGWVPCSCYEAECTNLEGHVITTLEYQVIVCHMDDTWQ
jgi:hypothetical protein